MDATVTSGELTTAPARDIQLASVLRIPAVRQVMLLIGVAASVAAGFAIVLWSQSPDYRHLYSGLEERDSAAVVSALQASGVDFDINTATGAIMVRGDQLHTARMQLASQGLPQTSSPSMDNVGDQSSFGVSQFMETARYQHALEGELSRTIKSLRSVQEARVHLAIPKQSAFIRDQQKPTASVLLHLYGGQQLEDSQSASIVNLVASSIPGMTPADVTLIDQFGRLMSVGDPMNDEALTANQFKIRRSVEQDYRRRIEQLLMPLLGPGNVRAEVVADLDFTINEQTTESYDPQSQVIRSEQVSEEQRKAADVIAEGAPGALANTPPEAGGQPGVDGTSESTVNSSRRATRNFEMDKTISRTRAPTGTVNRLSVAVLIDERAARAPAGDAESDASAATAGLTEDELARITALVREAVGFDAERGDTVEVLSAPFREAPEVAAAEEPPIWEQPGIRDMIKQGTGIVLALVLGFGVVRPMLKSIVAPPATGLTTLLPSANGDVSAAVSGQLSGPGAGAGLSYQDKVAAARNITGHDPARVAQVVRKWIEKDGG
ncbi:MAG: flagellar basal-body MS-ring/collar protein FliF [Pseudomonadota bacterium]